MGMADTIAIYVHVFGALGIVLWVPQCTPTRRTSYAAAAKLMQRRTMSLPFASSPGTTLFAGHRHGCHSS
jgi:hypothetical protein